MAWLRVAYTPHPILPYYRVTFVFARISSKKKDNNHGYGHGKYETFATMPISFALAAVEIGIYFGSEQIYIAATT
jgi:divalent metal cation (Fe/Co/Zn/Cd) transporter